MTNADDSVPTRPGIEELLDDLRAAMVQPPSESIARAHLTRMLAARGSVDAAPSVFVG